MLTGDSIQLCSGGEYAYVILHNHWVVLSKVPFFPCFTAWSQAAESQTECMYFHIPDACQPGKHWHGNE